MKFHEISTSGFGPPEISIDRYNRYDCYHHVGRAQYLSVFARLSSPLVTPRDLYRVLHRAVATRNRMPCPDITCRLCGTRTSTSPTGTDTPARMRPQ